MEIHSSTSDKGLRKLVVFDKDSVSVSILIMVRVGSRFENDRNAGVAHFVEHTIFKGTLKRPTSRQISMDVEMLGGKMNAFTSYDYTGYYIKVPKENFADAIEILSDMFLNSTFDKTEMEKERGVIIEEKRMYDDRPMDKVVDLFNNSLFKGNPLARDIIGTEESLTNMQRQDLVDFVEAHYGTKNTVVVISGGVDPKKANEEIDKNLSSLPEKEYSSFEKFKKRSVRKEFYHMNKPIAQSHLALGGLTPSRRDENRFALQLGSAILSKGFGSRLFQVIRDELGLAYYVYADLNLLDEVGALYVGLGVENNKIQVAVDAVMKQMNEVATGHFDEEEIERAKNYLIGNLTVGLEASNDMGMWHGVQLLLNDEVITIEDVKKKIVAIKKDEIVKVWSQIVMPSNIMLAAVTPHDELKINL